MKKVKLKPMSTKIILLSAIVILAPTLVAANEQSSERVDPSDVTRAYSQAHIGTSNKGDVKAMGALSYQFDGGTAAMVSLEATMDENGDYKDSRGQYFHVFGTGNDVMPRIATSLDVIDNNDFTTAAFGAAAAITTPFDSFNVYARGAGLMGEYKDDGALASKYNITDTDITGYNGAAWLVWKPFEDGTYFSLSPEYTKMDGNLEADILKTSITAATPITDGGDKWLQFKYEDIDSDFTHQGITDSVNDRIFWTQLKMFF